MNDKVNNASKVLDEMEVKAGEKVSRTKSIDLEGKKVTLFNVSKHDGTGKNYKVKWTFDFFNVSQEDLLELASRAAVIAFRKHFRGVDKSEIPNYRELTIDVQREVVEKERKPANPVEKVKKLMEGLGEEEKRKLLEELGLA